MITVRIGGQERECPVDPNWINQQIQGGRRDGGAPCVRVTIRSAELKCRLGVGWLRERRRKWRGKATQCPGEGHSGPLGEAAAART